MRQLSVLFVDDEVNVLNALRRSLKKEAYKTYLASGPEEAQEVLKSHEIDVVVSDQLMPSMDGISFLKLVKELYPQIIRVLLTGQADLKVVIQAINEGEVFRFLSKPWDDVELRITLRHILEFLELRRENQLLLDRVDKQQTLIDKMDSENPGIFKVERDETGAIILEMDIDELKAGTSFE